MELISFKISTDNSLLDKQNNITPYVSSLLTKLYNELSKGKKSTLEKLLKYTNQFPKVPTFKNYLFNYYILNDHIEKAMECNLWILKEHPNYLFSKLNYAATLIKEENFEEAKKILGPSLLLKDLYPERKEFHLDEVMFYFSTTINYLFAIDKGEEAKIRLNILKDIDDKHPKYLVSREMEIRYNLLQASKRMEKSIAIKKTVPKIDIISSVQTKIAPIFNFKKEIEKLYELTIEEISTKELEVFESLDQNKLTDDLILVLQDSINRFDYFNEEFYTNKNTVPNSPLHAILLLTHLKSEKAITTLLEVLKQNDDYINFWIGDPLFELMKPLLFNSNNNNEQEFLSFIKEPNIDAFNKNLVSEAFIQILYFKDNANRQELLNYCNIILDFLIENKENENILDTDFIALFILNLVDFRIEELLPKIKVFFDLEIVSPWICTGYEKVVKDISGKMNMQKPEKSTSFLDVYSYFKERWYSVEEKEYFPNYKNDELNKPYIHQGKIGRNESCPCGSGKKYKKCCLNL